MSAFETIIYENQDGVARITLNRPQVLNAYNIKMRDELHEAFGAIKGDDAVRAVIIKAAGEKAFCAGADLSEFLTAPPPVFARRARFARDIWGVFMSVPQPIIAALHGYVIGSGLEIALFCDIRIASDDVQFLVPEMGLGIITAAGASQTLPRTVNRGPAMEWLLTGRPVKAAEALKFGLVNRLVPRVELIPAAEELAGIINKMGPLQGQSIKQAVGRGVDTSLEEGLELEARLAARLLGSYFSPANDDSGRGNEHVGIPFDHGRNLS
jgi:enoyl-CoA hydratase/carnithine racemase